MEYCANYVTKSCKVREKENVERHKHFYTFQTFCNKKIYKIIQLETKLIITIKEVLPGFCIHKHINPFLCQRSACEPTANT
jgi:hypothetical protein